MIDAYAFDGLVHIIGLHENTRTGRRVFAECGRALHEEPGAVDGFLTPNTEEPATCIRCLGESRFGTYCPRVIPSP